MAESFLTGVEAAAVRGHDRAVVEDRSEEHLDASSRRVVERDDLFRITVEGLVLRQQLHLDAGLLDSFAHALQCELIAHLPADGERLVGVTGKHDQSCATLVDAQVEAVFLWPAADSHAEPVDDEFAPPSNVRGLDPEIARARISVMFEYSFAVEDSGGARSFRAWRPRAHHRAE